MSQKDFEITIELQPLITLFSQVSDEKMQFYFKALQPYDTGVIRNAVQKVIDKWDRISFPPPGVIVQECQKLGATSVAHNSNEEMPWIKRERENLENANQYFYAYRSNLTYREAEAEHWDYELMHYVRAVAHVQAQILNSAPNGRLIVEWYRIEPAGLKAAQAESWRKKFIHEQHDRMSIHKKIDVAIPTGKIQEWKQCALLAENEIVSAENIRAKV